jgi:hypothetical protein
VSEAAREVRDRVPLDVLNAWLPASDRPRELDPERLAFLRWLAGHGRLSSDLAASVVDEGEEGRV